jgi:hypothetical protein
LVTLRRHRDPRDGPGWEKSTHRVFSPKLYNYSKTRNKGAVCVRVFFPLAVARASIRPLADPLTKVFIFFEPGDAKGGVLDNGDGFHETREGDETVSLYINSQCARLKGARETREELKLCFVITQKNSQLEMTRIR